MSDYVLFFFVFFLPFTFYSSFPWLCLAASVHGRWLETCFGTTLWEGKRLAFCFFGITTVCFSRGLETVFSLYIFGIRSCFSFCSSSLALNSPTYRTLSWRGRPFFLLLFLFFLFFHHLNLSRKTNPS